MRFYGVVTLSRRQKPAVDEDETKESACGISFALSVFSMSAMSAFYGTESHRVLAATLVTIQPAVRAVLVGRQESH